MEDKKEDPQDDSSAKGEQDSKTEKPAPPNRGRTFDAPGVEKRG